MKFSIFLCTPEQAHKLLSVLQEWAVCTPIIIDQKRLPARGIGGFGFTIAIDTRRIPEKLFAEKSTELRAAGIEFSRQ